MTCRVAAAVCSNIGHVLYFGSPQREVLDGRVGSDAEAPAALLLASFFFFFIVGLTLHIIDVEGGRGTQAIYYYTKPCPAAGDLCRHVYIFIPI